MSTTAPRLYAVPTWQNDAEERSEEKLPLTPWVWIVLWISCSGGFINGFGNSTGLLVFMSTPFLVAFFPRAAEVAFQQVAQRRAHALHSPSDQYCLGISVFREDRLALYNSSRYMAAVVSVPFAAWVVHYQGRKRGVGIGAITFVVGTVIMGTAFATAQLYVGSAVMGISQAFFHMATALENVEVAPTAHRGAFGGCLEACYTVGLTCGILVYLAPPIRTLPNGWRIVYAMRGWMGLVVLSLLYWLPESPSSLVQRGDMAQARDALRAIRGELYSSSAIEHELLDMYCGAGGAANAEQGIGTAALLQQLRLLCSRKQLPIILLMVLFSLVKEAIGPLTTMHVTPLVLDSTLTGNKYLAATLVAGASYVVGTIIGLFLSDTRTLGRRGSLFLGAGVSAACCIATVMLLLVYDEGCIPYRVVFIALCAVFVVYGAFGGILQALYATVMPENLPLSTRSVGVGICLMVWYLTRMLVQYTIEAVLCSTKWGLFLLLCAAHLCIVLIAWLIPEASNVPLERVDALWHKHCFFGQCMQSGQQSL